MSHDPTATPPTFYISFYGGPFDGLTEPFTVDPSVRVYRLEIRPDHDPDALAVYLAVPGVTDGLVRPLFYGGTFTP